ncbi:MAG: glycosyl transferase [Flavobacteriales bacterium]|nr:glycosyl transferase [Bacteroidota bacterium]MCB9241517.1 glycosyl transferase [Flavobacteriales bacterium]
MKVLYAIQGTGNGHISRALDLVPRFKKRVDCDVMISGIQADIVAPFEMNHRCQGMSFIFGKTGGINYVSTLQRTSIFSLLHEINHFPIEQYDAVINDFEPVTSWAAKLKNIPCISLSHQSAVLGPNAPKPKSGGFLAKQVLKRYAPCDYALGFHFDTYDEQTFSPIIRNRVRQQPITNNGHYTVYLPAYSDERIIRQLRHFGDLKWEVFSKHTRTHYQVDNVFIQPIENEAFVNSMASSEGVLCGAGFETPAEALYMGKKLMVIPMKSQYEQHCNAAGLKVLGIPVINGFGDAELHPIADWLMEKSRLQINYPDNAQRVVDRVIGFTRELLGNHQAVQHEMGDLNEMKATGS